MTKTEKDDLVLLSSLDVTRKKAQDLKRKGVAFIMMSDGMLWTRLRYWVKREDVERLGLKER